MLYAEGAQSSDPKRSTVTNEIERACTRAHKLANHAEEIANHLYGSAPTPIEGSAQAVPPANVTLSLSRLHDLLARCEGAMQRIDQGLR
jgi:hypothetical protein